MKWHFAVSFLLLLGSVAVAAEPPRATISTVVPDSSAADFSAPAVEAQPAMLEGTGTVRREGGLLDGNHNFPNFIGFISNPVESIDPRAVTEMYPIFESAWTSAFPPLSAGNLQVYGAGLTVALGERLAVGLNQGGFVVSRFRDGHHDGWLNLGGFAQFTFIEDVEDQFLVTGGMRVTVPSGESSVFQGHGRAQLAPYLTAGKEFGEFHVLATAGYQFPAGSGDRETNLFYANLHIDRRVCCWLYPLVEFNTSYHTTTVNLNLPTRRDFFDLGTFEATGNIVTVAAGFDAVIVPERFEIGVVYMTPIASQHGFDFDAVLVRMTFRY